MEYNFSDRVKNLSGNAIREIFKLVSRPEVISFAGGLPASDCLPTEQVATFSAQLLSDGAVARQLLQYGATEGYMPLRVAMTRYLERVGIQGLTTDNVLIISGGQQGIDLTFKAFINKGDVILVENPTYLAVLHIAKTYEAQVIGVDTDSDGVNLESLERAIIKNKPKVFYVVPNFQNPTGITLPVEKRKAIAELSAKYGVMVLEDDPYRDLRYEGRPLPSIKSFDKAGNVLFINSFSKTISPALRVGAIAGEQSVIRKLTIGKQAVDVHTVTLSQAIVLKFIESGELDKVIDKAVPIYRTKKNAMIKCLDKYMPSSFTHTNPDGGLFIWGTFDPASKINTAELFIKAVEKNVAYVSGKDFYADGSGLNTLRMNFSGASVEQIEDGIKRLSEIFKG